MYSIETTDTSIFFFFFQVCIHGVETNLKKLQRIQISMTSIKFSIEERFSGLDQTSRRKWPVTSHQSFEYYRTKYQTNTSTQIRCRDIDNTRNEVLE